MLNSNGKMPDGLFSESRTLCDMMATYGDGTCHPVFKNFSETHPLPEGYSASLGDFYTCIDVVADYDGSSDVEWEGFSGSFCPMSVSSNGDDTGPRSRLATNVSYPRGGAYWAHDILANVGPVSCLIKTIQMFLNLKLNSFQEVFMRPPWQPELGFASPVGVPPLTSRQTTTSFTGLNHCL